MVDDWKVPDWCRAIAKTVPARAPSARSTKNSSRLIAGSFHFLLLTAVPSTPSFPYYLYQNFPADMLAFFLHVRYNSYVKYFEVFEIYFINSDIRKYFMEIRNLITFTKVAETQSLSKAAKALGYAQSTVTMQMQQLEQELGAQLYERVGKQIRITQIGQEFLSYAGAIVRMSEDALMVGRQKEAAVSGSLRLGILSPLSPAVGSAIARYLQSYPQVDLEVQTVQNPDDLLSRLRHNEIDLALTLDTLYTDADLLHALEDQPVPVHYYTNKAHPLTSHAGPGAEDVSHYPIIRTSCYNSRANVSASRQLYIADPGLALSIAASADPQSGSSVIVPVPDLIAQNHPLFQNLARLNCECDIPSLWLQTLYHRNKWLTGAMKAWLSDSQKLSFSL